MKALFTCIFIAFFTAAAAWAQTPPQNPPKSERPSRIIGIRGGGNIANITGYDLAFGYHAGVFVDMLPGKSAGYGLEINYSRQGGTIENTSIVANYLVIPVLFNLYGSEVAFQVGPYAAPLLNARPKRSNYNYTDSMSGLDYGVAIGLKRSYGEVGVGVRYYQGLEKPNNRNLQISLRINL